MTTTFDVSDAVEQEAQMSYADKVRSNLDTESLPAIMARYEEAVRWRQ